MTRSTTLGLAVAFAFGLAVPALAQTASTQTAPAAPAAAAPAAPADSGLKATAPDTKPVASTKHRHSHTRHAVKAAPAASN